MSVEEFERLKKKMREISGEFKRRAEFHKEKFSRPLTPSSEALKALDKEIEDKKTEAALEADVTPEKADPQAKWLIHPQSGLMTLTLAVQTLAFLYNAWAIPLRFSFTVYQTEANQHWWALADYTVDLIYLLDSIFIKTRVMFINEFGVYEKDAKKIALNLLRTKIFLFDVASLAPLDFGYFIFGFHGRATILRLPRVLRGHYFNCLFERLDSSASYPMLVRLSKTVNIMLFLIHVNACAYYAYSDFEGLDSSPYVFNGHGHAYIRCFYVALKTSMSIGINPKPGKDRPWQMIFMGCLWLMGVFVFAVLIGNVKDIIAQSTAAQDEYMARFDHISGYMHAMKVPPSTVERVKRWCSYTWATQKSFDELAILDALPLKLRTDVTMNVHYETLRKVTLFHGCDPGLLKELVVKLRPIIFLDGDYICKKGDIGKEMFIITVGQVQVVGGPDDSIVFVTLGSGVCFGEIALLGSGGMNRRTANVRALGYTTLYVLYKEDLAEALNVFPADRELLSRKAAKAAKEVTAKQAAEAKKKLEEEEKAKKKTMNFFDLTRKAMKKKDEEEKRNEEEDTLVVVQVDGED